MAGDITTIARPYAEAVFRRAVESDKLAVWSGTLDFLATVMQAPGLRGLIGNPKLVSAQKVELMLEIGGDHLSEEGRNFVSLLAANRRLGLLPEIRRLYKQYKAGHEGTVDVEVVAAYDLQPAQEQLLSEAMQAKLGRTVNIQSRTDPDLIGGIRLRAGDMVIDGSVSSQLNQMAHELGI